MAGSGGLAQQVAEKLADMIQVSLQTAMILKFIFQCHLARQQIFC